MPNGLKLQPQMEPRLPFTAPRGAMGLGFQQFFLNPRSFAGQEAAIDSRIADIRAQMVRIQEELARRAAIQRIQQQLQGAIRGGPRQFTPFIQGPPAPQP